MPDLDGTAGLDYFIILLWGESSDQSLTGLPVCGVAVPDLDGTARLLFVRNVVLYLIYCFT